MDDKEVVDLLIIKVQGKVPVVVQEMDNTLTVENDEVAVSIM